VASDPTGAATDIMESVAQRYAAATAITDNDYERSRQLGYLFNDVGQGLLGAGTVLRGASRLGAAGGEMLGENAFTGPLAGGRAAQRGGVGVGDATTSNPNTTTRFVDGVVVVERRSGQTLQGTVDLQPTIDRIQNGISYPHRNDGAVFQNRSPLGGHGVPLLPKMPMDYYHEYVVPTPGVTGPGPQRIVVGRGGEMYYTPDHYQSFIKIRTGN